MPLLRHHFNLTNKLALLVTVAVLVALGVLGVYFDGFLKRSFLENTQGRMEHAFSRLAYNLGEIERELMEGAALADQDEALIASTQLINNYQDKQNYNVYLIDEEKKLIAEELLKRVKLSFNDDIALYDGNGELTAFVTLEKQGYHLNFISYAEGKPRLFSRYEPEPLYTEQRFHPHPGIPFQHTDLYAKGADLRRGQITYHNFGGALGIRSHLSFFEPGREGDVGHLELSKVLDRTYFEDLSRALDLAIDFSFQSEPGLQPGQLGADAPREPPNITQTEERYLAAMTRDTLDGPVYFVARLEKRTLQRVLHENRLQFLLILVLLASAVLLAMRSIFHYRLAQPLGRLMEQIRKIERQDYSHQEFVRSGDELELISKSVNDLSGAVQEREQSLRQSQDELAHLSRHDSLTDLYNRRFFAERLEHALNLARRNHQGFALLFLDVDHFKLVNDTLGHDVGDVLLIEVSKRLLRHVRNADTLARIGGDEFNILIENVASPAEIEPVIEKLVELFRRPFFCNGHEINATVSIGVALFPVDGEDSVSLTKHADLAMYRSKENGRNNYSFFADALSRELQERTEKTQALRDAIAAGDQFQLLYQPKISVSTHRIAAIEALLRWRRPEYGLVPPDQFIPLAEETGLIIPIGQWVLNRACSDFMQLGDDGIHLEHVSINLSSVQLQHSDMLATLEDAFAATHIVPSMVELEITESYIATDVKEAVRALERFRTMKIRLAIDDFGTGYSSMSYLQQLPVTRIKIDKAFIDGLPHNPQNVAITRAIIALAKAFKLSITAEGVENAEQLAFLEAEQCDEIQGYYYAKPLELEALKDYCKASVNGLPGGWNQAAPGADPGSLH